MFRRSANVDKTLLQRDCVSWVSLADLLQLVIEAAISKPVDNKYLQSTCPYSKPVDKLQQTCRQQAAASHANLQDVNRLVAILRVFVCVDVRVDENSFEQ